MAARPVFKFPIYFMNDVFIRAYPFHMAQGMFIIISHGTKYE